MELVSDARCGLRRWAARPLFAIVAIATIALSTGAATALFSLVDGVLLKPLPYPAPGRLVLVNRTYPDWVRDPILSRSWDRISLAWPEFFFIREKTRTLETLAVRTSSLGLLPPPDAHELRVDVVSASYFSLFGVHPVAGRLFDPDDDRTDRRVVLLNEGLWRSRFAGDPGVVGRSLALADGARTIIGIVPLAFRMGSAKPDIWEPLATFAPARRVDNDRNLDAYARLRDGVSIADAEAEMQTLLRQNFRFSSKTGARVTSLMERQVAPVRTPLFILLGGALLLLVIACANIAAFLAGDAASRVHEMLVRAALGASRRRLLRQLLVESALLAGAGGMAGWLVAAWTVRGLLALAPGSMPRLMDVRLDGHALAFAIGSTALAALLAGTVPALVLARNAVGSLAAGSSRVTPAHRRLRRRLLIAQLTVAITLFAGAGLFVRTLRNLNARETGFTRANLLTARISLPQPLYAKPEQVDQYFRRAESAIAQLPGVDAAAVTSGLPFATGRASTSIVLGEDAQGGSREVEAQRRFVSPEYFRVIQLPIIAGRGFSRTESSGPDLIVVVSREMAQQFWNGAAIGRRFSQGPLRFFVIGIAADVRDQTLAAEPMSTFYISTAQRQPWPTMRIVARTRVPPSSIADSAQKALREIDPSVPVEDVATMEDLVSTSLEDQRYRAALLTVFAAVATVLTAIGVYGALARAVAERRREIGVRLALGASPQQVARMFLIEAGWMATIGGTVGLCGSAIVARICAKLLFGVATLDASTVVLALVGASAMTLAGAYVPARRASRLEAAAVLRSE